MKQILALILVVYVAYLAGFATYHFLFRTPTSIQLPPITTIKTPEGLNKGLALEDFDIVLITKNTPSHVFHINHLMNRREGYAQTQLLYSLDGTSLKTKMVPFENVTPTLLTDSQNNLAYSISGNLDVEGNKITFEIPFIQLGMVIRAQPEAGKYGGETYGSTAIVTINGIKNDAYGLVTASYFNIFEPVDLVDYKVKTHWLMLLGSNKNFYHLDKSSMDKSTKDYYPHTFFGEINPNNKTTQYFSDINLTKLSNGNYEISYSNDVPQAIDLEVKATTALYQHTKAMLVTTPNGGTGVLIELDATK